MEKIKEEKLKRELAFDQYGRYAITESIIDKNRIDDESFKILDVGGRGNMLRGFLEKDNVYYLDPLVETDDDNYIEGDGCDIPLPDNSYDFVVSADVFEHIHEDNRDKFIKENLRVAKKGVILGAPFWSKEVAEAETSSNRRHKEITGLEHLWLKEHIENGLPEEKELKNFLEKKGLDFQKIGNNNMLFWEFFTRVSMLVSNNFHPEIKKKFADFNYEYNTVIYPNDMSVKDAYRKIFFIKKDKNLKDITFNKELPRMDATSSILKKGLDLVEEIEIINKKIMDERLAEIEESINNKKELPEKQKIVIEQKNKKIDELTGLLNVKEHEIAWMQSSKFWKLRNIYAKFKKIPKVTVRVYRKSILVFKREGFAGFFGSVFRHLGRSNGKFWVIAEPDAVYGKWIMANEAMGAERYREEMGNFKYNPKISVILPVYNISSKWLNKCIDSVVNQYYPNWELCIHDDKSTNEDTIRCLKDWAKKGDKRIKISYGKENQHISGASNDAIKLATGEYIALLDNDDEISPNALFENVKFLNDHPDTDMIYSDEDKLDERGNRSDPFFKPGWTLDLMLSVMYTCHLGVYRKSIVDKIGGFRKGYEGAQDYDLVLRFIEETKEDRIRHIPKILYHWRMLKTSTALSSGSKSYAYIAGERAISDYLKRNKIEGKVVDGVAPGFFRVIREIKGDPLVSIIIPFKDLSDVLERCIKSIKEKTSYPNYEIVLVNNQSEESKTKKYLESLKDDPKIKIFSYDKPFNYSAINNFAVKKSKGKYILFLNNDTEVISEEWLTAMLEQIQREDVGAVGAKLLFPNDTVQHAGVIIGIGGAAGHIYHSYRRTSLGYMGQLHTIRNYNAVTAACMMVKKDLFEEIGGLDEKNLPIAFNDIDLCLKIREKGFKIIFTPYALLYHYESLSRGYDEDFQESDPEKYKRVVEEREYFKKRWASWLEGDQYYNENFSYGDDGKIWPQQIQAP